MIFLHARVHHRAIDRFAQEVTSRRSPDYQCAIAACPLCPARYVSVPGPGLSLERVEAVEETVGQMLKTECPDHRHRLIVGA